MLRILTGPCFHHPSGGTWDVLPTYESREQHRLSPPPRNLRSSTGALFGFDGSCPPPPASRSPPSGAWVDQTDPDVAARVFDLLSPRGVLMSSVSVVDRHSLVKFVFPVERLPEWMRFALQNERLCSVLPDLCPLFRSRVKEDPVQGSCQIQLNVFEYYMFWFAYYPICRGKSENSDAMVVRKSRRFRLENWTSSWPTLSSSSSQSGQKRGCSLYLRLLYAYLRAFVPKRGLGVCQPYRSSLFHYSSNYDGSVILQAEFLVYTFIQFWMVDNDFSPLPVSLCSSFGLSFPFQAVLGETPPTPGLGEVLLLLVRYLNSTLVSPSDGSLRVEYGEDSGWNSSPSYNVGKSSSVMVSSDGFVDSWNSLIRRPLYRFILRSFLFCPIGSSMRNSGQVFSLWTSYMEPWKISPEDFLEFEAPVIEKSETSGKNRNHFQDRSNEGKERCRSELGYTSAWEGYITSNYLFYSSLVVHFLGFAHKFLHANVETMTQMVLKVLNVLTSSRELTDLLRKIDAAYHSKYAGPSLATSDSAVYKCIPSIRQQLQDWENGLCESDADGSFLCENWNRDLRLFSDNEDGAHRLLQLFILRAESEIQSLPRGNTAQNLQNLDALRSQMSTLFGGPVRISPSPAMSKVAGSRGSTSGEGFTPKHPGVGKSRWADVKYRGEWMRRPISDSEVAWLARLLVKLSDRLNAVLGLHQSISGISDGPVYIKLSPNDVVTAGRPKEALWMLLALVGSWLGSICHTLVEFMRERGIRINLRPLASKKFVLVLLVYAIVTILRKTVGRSSVLG
ncbi:hypothetical protein Taro_049026 [Colocasia esculenta]|uniref:Sphingomyelin phosphodiesterase 4 n=1 Tax=Colocasia esculenta TaxID=4460 RepID=A0A843X9P0_COLES|nr:hypothetical protein [Colocasia esculenta]